MVLTRNNIPAAGCIYWKTAQNGYPFKPMQRYRIKESADAGKYISVRISLLNRQNFRLENGEVTPDVLSQALYDA